MVRKIVKLETTGFVFDVSGQLFPDGYTTESIEFRQQGLVGINSITNSGPQPSYLITLIGEMNDKDKKFIVVVADEVKTITFVEEEDKKKDDIPEPRRG